MDCSPPGFSVHKIFQGRMLEWVAISFFKKSSQPRDRTCISRFGRWMDSLPLATSEAPFSLTRALNSEIGNSLAVQCLGVHNFTAECPGSIPGWGTKILQAKRHIQKSKNKQWNNFPLVLFGLCRVEIISFLLKWRTTWQKSGLGSLL